MLGLELDVLKNVVEDWDGTATQHPLDGIVFIEVGVPWGFRIPMITTNSFFDLSRCENLESEPLTGLKERERLTIPV